MKTLCPARSAVFTTNLQGCYLIDMQFRLEAAHLKEDIQNRQQYLQAEVSVSTLHEE